MSETPREPDRFDAKGEELACAYHTARCPDRATLARQIAAALRAAEADALERAAQAIDTKRNGTEGEDRNTTYYRGGLADAARTVRALASPAAAPAAEPDQVSRILGRGHVENPREGEPGDTETYSEPVAPAPDLRAMLAHGIADAEGYIQTERQQGDVQMESFHAGRRAAYQQLEAALDRLAARTSPGGAGEGKT